MLFSIILVLVDAPNAESEPPIPTPAIIGTHDRSSCNDECRPSWIESSSGSSHRANDRWTWMSIAGCCGSVTSKACWRRYAGHRACDDLALR